MKIKPFTVFFHGSEGEAQRFMTPLTLPPVKKTPGAQIDWKLLQQFKALRKSCRFITMLQFIPALLLSFGSPLILHPPEFVLQMETDPVQQRHHLTWYEHWPQTSVSPCSLWPSLHGPCPQGDVGSRMLTSQTPRNPWKSTWCSLNSLPSLLNQISPITPPCQAAPDCCFRPLVLHRPQCPAGPHWNWVKVPFCSWALYKPYRCPLEKLWCSFSSWWHPTAM